MITGLGNIPTKWSGGGGGSPFWLEIGEFVVLEHRGGQIIRPTHEGSAGGINGTRAGRQVVW